MLDRINHPSDQLEGYCEETISVFNSLKRYNPELTNNQLIQLMQIATFNHYLDIPWEAVKDFDILNNVLEEIADNIGETK